MNTSPGDPPRILRWLFAGEEYLHYLGIAGLIGMSPGLVYRLVTWQLESQEPAWYDIAGILVAFAVLLRFRPKVPGRGYIVYPIAVTHLLAVFALAILGGTVIDILV